MIKVTIAIPVYNTSQYLDRCLQSAINQTYKNIEILVIDDKSTDNSAEIIKKYEHNGVKYIYNENHNGFGASSARNECIKHATGDYFLFVDSDDYMHKNTVENLIKLIEIYEADIVQYPLAYYYDNGDIEKEIPLYEDCLFVQKKDFNKFIYKEMLNGIRFNSVCRNMYKTSILKRNFFKTDMHTAEDILFNIGVFSIAQSFLYTTQVEYIYCIRKNGLTGNFISVNNKIASNFVVSGELKSCLKHWGMNTPINIIKAYTRLIRLIICKLPKYIKRAKSTKSDK